MWPKLENCFTFYNTSSYFNVEVFYGFLRYFKIYWFQLGNSIFYFLQCAELFWGWGDLSFEIRILPQGLRRRIAVRINAQQPQPASSFYSVFLCFSLFYSVLLCFSLFYSFSCPTTPTRVQQYRLRGNNWQKTIFQARPLKQLHSAQGRGGTIQ